MAGILRLLISIFRLVLLGLYIFSTFKSINEQPLPLLIASFLFLYLITVAMVIVNCLKSLEDLYINMLNFTCYYTLLFIHLLFCINISKSSALKDILEISLSPYLFFIQLFLQIIQCAAPFWYLLDNARLDSILLLITLVACGLEGLMVICIFCKKVNKKLTVAE